MTGGPQGWVAGTVAGITGRLGRVVMPSGRADRGRRPWNRNAWVISNPVMTIDFLPRSQAPAPGARRGDRKSWLRGESRRGEMGSRASKSLERLPNRWRGFQILADPVLVGIEGEPKRRSWRGRRADPLQHGIWKPRRRFGSLGGDLEALGGDLEALLSAPRARLSVLRNGSCALLIGRARGIARGAVWMERSGVGAALGEAEMDERFVGWTRVECLPIRAEVNDSGPARRAPRARPRRRPRS